MNDVIKINLGDKELIIDPSRLEFNEVTLTEFFQKSHGYYDNLGRGLANLEALYQTRKMELDEISSRKFDEYKTVGKISDKLAQAKTDSDPEVLAARKRLISVGRNVSMVKNHLKAWDKAHENALSTGHFLRKEMDKLGTVINESQKYREIEEEIRR